MNKNYDAAVIGGGVIGGSIAYQLAKRGKKVILLEKGRLAGESSGAAAGMLGAQVEMGEETGPLFELAIQSRAMFPEIAQELREVSGIDISLINRGMLRIATSQEQAAELQGVLKAQQKAGQSAEWLTGDEVRLREPGLSEAVLGALHIPHDGQVLAPELSLAFLKSAAAMGAEIREYAEVTSLIIEQGKVTGIATSQGQIACQQVIAAAGAWSGELFARLGITLPVYPVKGECFSVVSHRPLLEATVFSHGCYLVPKKGGRLVVGATVKEGTFDRRVSVDGISVLLEKAKRLLPGIAEAEWEKAWAGVRPQTKDALPYLGEHPEWKGFFVAAGHFRNGILLGPITGILMADLLEGKETKMDLNPFRLNR